MSSVPGVSAGWTLDQAVEFLGRRWVGEFVALMTDPQAWCAGRAAFAHSVEQWDRYEAYTALSAYFASTVKCKACIDASCVACDDFGRVGAGGVSL